MAAEATRLDEVQAGLIPLTEALTFGNNRASRFSNLQAEQFAAQYEVVAHQKNTATGFSGTVFRNRDTNELTISFRSTEFIDDAARDSQATNAMEVAQGGWAMGQIADMEDWFETLNQPGGVLAGKNFSVTGYGLGGQTPDTHNRGR